MLYLLSQKYFVTQYPSAWSCGPVREVINSDLSSSPYSYQLRKSFGVPRFESYCQFMINP